MERANQIFRESYESYRDELFGDDFKDEIMSRITDEEFENDVEAIHDMLDKHVDAIITLIDTYIREKVK